MIKKKNLDDDETQEIQISNPMPLVQPKPVPNILVDSQMNSLWITIPHYVSDLW